MTKTDFMIECCDTSGSATTPSLDGHFDAVVLFAMLTTCTWRFTSASGLPGRKPVAAVVTS